MSASPSPSRELTVGLAPAVLDAGPPPSPVAGAGWGFRAVGVEGPELDLVHRWMNTDHVAIRWDQAWSREHWAAEIAGQLAGSHSRPWVVSRDGHDVAYVEVYRPARDVVALHYDAAAADLGVHIAIGDPALTGRGLGTAVIRAVTDGLFEASPACARVLADPEAGHTVARAMFARAGFTLLVEVELPHKRAALMLCPRGRE